MTTPKPPFCRLASAAVLAWALLGPPAAAQPAPAADVSVAQAPVAPASAAKAREAESREPLVRAAADRERLERVMAEGRVARRQPKPSWNEWIYHLSTRFGAWLAGLLAGGLDATRNLGPLWTVLLWGIFALTVAAVLFWLFRWMKAILGREGERGAPAGPEGSRSPGVDLRSAGEWRRALDEHLAAGRLEAALEAAWWWLARSLAADRADPSWTGGELVRRAGRPDLSPAVARFDRLAYGPAGPSGPEIASLVEELERSLAASPSSAPPSRLSVAGSAG